MTWKANPSARLRVSEGMARLKQAKLSAAAGKTSSGRRQNLQRPQAKLSGRRRNSAAAGKTQRPRPESPRYSVLEITPSPFLS